MKKIMVLLGLVTSLLAQADQRVGLSWSWKYDQLDSSSWLIIPSGESVAYPYTMQPLGTTQSYRAIVPEGYAVAGWSYGRCDQTALNTGRMPTYVANENPEEDTFALTLGVKEITGFSLGVHFEYLKYDISFNGNGGEGETLGIVAQSYEAPIRLTWNEFAKTGYAFRGWGRSAGATDVAFANNATVTGEDFGFTYRDHAVTLYALWSANDYVVSFNPNAPNVTLGESERTVTFDGTYGSKGTLPKPTRTGYTFVNWRLGSETGEIVREATVVATPGNHELVAEWRGNAIEVTLDPCGGNINSSFENPTTVSFGSTYGAGTSGSLPRPEKYGHREGEWRTAPEGNGYLVENGTKVTTVGNHTLYANYAPKTWALNIYAGDGRAEFSQKDITFGRQVGYLPKATKEGSTHVGWYDQQHRPVTETDIVTNETLTAIWAEYERVPYTVRLDTQGGVGGTESVVAYYGSVPPEIVAPTKEGYVFGGYYSQPEGQGTIYYQPSGVAYQRWNQANEGTLYAKWTVKSYVVTLDRQGGVGGTSWVSVDWQAPLPSAGIPTRPGEKFLGYFREQNGQGRKFFDETGVGIGKWDIDEKEPRLYAHWGVGEYTVTFMPNAEDGVSVIPQTKTVTRTETYGELPDPIVPTDYPYAFAGWYTARSSGSQVTAATTVDATGDHLLYAHWTPKTYAITYRVTEGEMRVAPATGTYGENVTFSWEPTETPGYMTELKEVIVYAGVDATGDMLDSYSYGSSVSFSMNRDYHAAIFVDVVFEKTAKKYQVAFDGNGGSASSSWFEVTYGGTYPSLPTATRTGYTFDGWWTAVTGGTRIEAGAPFTEVKDQRLYAHWLQDAYTVVYHGGEAATGEMSDQPIAVGSSAQLRKNEFKHKGYTFLGWSTNEAAAAEMKWDYVDEQVGVVLPAKKDEVVNLYAAWTNNTYTIRFWPNGGEGKIADVVATYDKEVSLPVGGFEREGYELVGWLTDPTNEVVHVDSIENLTDAPDDVANLYAKWQMPDPKEFSAYAKAADSNIDLTADSEEWCTVENDESLLQPGDESGYVKLCPMNEGEFAVAVIKTDKFKGKGTLRFSTFVCIVPGMPDNLEVKTNGVKMAEFNISSGWDEHSYSLPAGEDRIVEWSFKAYANKILPNPCYALIDKVKWEVEEDPELPTGLTFRMNNGTAAPADIVTNGTFTVGQPIGMLPTLTHGWKTTNTWALDPEGTQPIDETWVVTVEDCQLYAQWEADKTATVPTAVTGLVYSGHAVTGVVAATGFDLGGNVATNAGSYVATATPQAGYVWADATTGAKTIAWSIAQATYDMSGISFTNATYLADGKAKSLEITGTLPKGVEVAYSENNNLTEPGTNTVTATFTGDAVNYKAIAAKTATLTVLAEPEPERTPVEVPTAVTGLAFTGSIQTGVVATNGFDLVGNVATNAGDYVAVATPQPGYAWTDGTTNAQTIAWSIAKATYDMSGISFTNATYVADGTVKSLAITGTLPTGVSVAYSENNSQTEPGVNEVTAMFAGDDVNYEVLAPLTATLTVLAPEPDPLIPIEIPDAVTNLVYTGNCQTGVVTGAHFDLVGNVATNAGDYVATATPHAGYAWTSGSTNAQAIAWAIMKARHDLSGISFTNATYVADGTAKSLAITGTLPAGVTVAYSANNSLTEPGTNTVTATFAVDAVNYEAIAPLTAILTVLPTPEPEPDPLTPVAVPVAEQGLVYAGLARTGVLATEGVALIGNVATNAGAYVATATPLEGYSWTDGSTNTQTIAWEIAKATYDMSGVSFADATYVADGTPKTLEIAGTLPNGVRVSYANNGLTGPGRKTVTANFTGDATNYRAIASLTATLTVVEPPKPGPESDGILYPNTGALTPFAGNATYVGWLRREGRLAGLVTIKAAKPNKRTGESKLTITATPMVGKKATVKKSAYLGDVQVDGLTLSAESVTGALTVNGVTYDVMTGLDYFKSSDKAEKAKAKAMAVARTYTFAITNARETVCVSATIAKSTGKAKFAVYLPDGTKVSVSSQGVYGEDFKTYAIPVAYVKKTVSFGFVLWVDADGRAAVTDLTETDAAAVEPVQLALPKGESRLVVEPLPEPYLEDYSPTGLTVTMNGTKWTVAKTDAAVKLKCDKYGCVTGSCKLFSESKGRAKGATAKIVGVVVGGRFVGTVYIKNKVYLSAWTEPVR